MLTNQVETKFSVQTESLKLGICTSGEFKFSLHHRHGKSTSRLLLAAKAEKINFTWCLVVLTAVLDVLINSAALYIYL